jgi:hypothetical protein
MFGKMMYTDTSEIKNQGKGDTYVITNNTDRLVSLQTYKSSIYKSLTPGSSLKITDKDLAKFNYYVQLVHIHKLTIELVKAKTAKNIDKVDLTNG